MWIFIRTNGRHLCHGRFALGCPRALDETVTMYLSCLGAHLLFWLADSFVGSWLSYVMMATNVALQSDRSKG